MDHQISSICSTAHFHIYNIGKIRKYLNRHSLESIVHALITSKLDYCNSLLNGISKTQLNRLQRVQNTAAPLITGVKRNAHITPILKNLHWLPVDKRIAFKILLIVFKCTHQMAPNYLKALIKPYKPNRDLRSATQNFLHVPRSISSLHSRPFSQAGPRLWNDLPASIRGIDCIHSFKTHLKTFLFNTHFD